MRSDQAYSRIVFWLKVSLPLLALGLLSAMFLISNAGPQTTKIPFSEKDLSEKTAEQRITEPVFTGKTEFGDLLRLAADYARPDPAHEASVLVTQMNADLTTPRESKVAFQSASGSFNGTDSSFEMNGDVVITSTTGYSLTATRVTGSFTNFTMVAHGPIEGEGPEGSLSAGQLELQGARDGENLRIWFTKGVKLVYDPRRQGVKDDND